MPTEAANYVLSTTRPVQEKQLQPDFLAIVQRVNLVPQVSVYTGGGRGAPSGHREERHWSRSAANEELVDGEA